MKHVDPHTVELLARRERVRAAIEARIQSWIDAMDALDALMEDIEFEDEGDELDRGEEDNADAEPTLGWSNVHNQAHLDRGGEDGDRTATERHGKGFVRCGPDDAEDGHDAEAVNEDGGDINDEPHGPDAELEVEDWLSGYTEDVAKRFRTPDVREAVAKATGDLNAIRFRSCQGVNVLRGPGSLPGGIPIVGSVR